MCRCRSIFDAHKYSCIQCFDKFSLDPRKLNETSKNYGTILHMLCRNPIKNKDKIIHLIIRGINPNITDANGYTFLQRVIGVSYSDAERDIIKQLLVSPILDINKLSDNIWGWTALHEAIKYHKFNKQFALLLLDHPNIDVNKKDIKGWSPLHYALNDIELMTNLINKGADINIQDNDGNTPLHIVSINNYMNCAQLLLERGADLFIVNKKGETVVQCALNSLNYNNDLVRLLKLFEAFDDVKEAIE